MPTDPNLIPVDNPILGMIDAAADRYGVDRNLAHVVAQMESNYNPQAVSKAGAQGVMQLMPATARGLGVGDSFDPAQNIDGGVKYLAQLSGRYGGDPRLVLAAYNAGPGAVDKTGDVPPYGETQNYVAKGTRMLSSASPPDLSADPNLTPVPVAQAPPQTRRQPSVEVLPPLSEPPGEKPAPPEKTVKGFLDNVTLGLGRIIEPLTDPAGTLENVTNLIQGMSEKSGFAPVMGQPKQQVVDGIVNLYKHRYGSLEGFKNAWYDDPVGMAGDVAMVFSGAGLGTKAAQEFLKASGVADHAAQIAEVLPKVPAGAAAETRVQAGIRGAVEALGKRYPEVVQAGMEKAPSGVLGGPHGMLSTAKYGAAKKAGQILKEGWQAATKAYDGPAAASAAEEAATAATPKAAPAVVKTPGQVLAESEGQDWTKLTATDQQLMEQIARAQSNVAAQPPPQPSAAPPLTPQELTELETGRPPSRQSEAAQQAAAETLATAHAAETPPAAPQAAPAAPEAPAATQEPVADPIVPEAPQTPQPASAVQKLTDYVIEKKIAPHILEKFEDPHWRMIADNAGTAAPTADEIAQIKANVAAQEVPQGEQIFQEQKARGEETMTPPKETPPAAPGGAALTPLQKMGIPEHYQYLHDIDPYRVGPAFEKDIRVADYLLSKNITPEEFAAKTLAEQNKLISEAPSASAGGKHRSYVPKPEGNPPRTKGRWAHEGIQDIVNTMRWRQAQMPAAAPEAATIPTEGIETPAQGKAAFEAQQAKPAPAKRTRRARPKS